jgi:UDP-2,3-diacylglucosamine hydrolase
LHDPRASESGTNSANYAMSMPARAEALFISDLHLQESHPRTAAAFFRFLEERAMAARELYLLGDLFEYWAGDDDLDSPFHKSIIGAIRAVSDAGVAVYWIAGNRDFLVGERFAQAAGLTLLSEPHVASIAGQRIALVHGDAECTADTNYMAFRAQVRDPAWQQQFLAMPLEAVDALHACTGADIIIHGHTHRPALHQAGARRRYVLPDWELDAEPARGGWIAVDSSGAVTRHGLEGQVI